MKTPRILHIVKWYPHSADPQNGVFVRKHIHAVDSEAAVLGFLNHSDPPEINGASTLYGSKNMSTAAKWGAYFAKVKAVQPDIIHFHCYAPDLVPLLWFAKRAGLTTVHSEHWSGFLPQSPYTLNGWRKFLARWYLNNCHMVLPVSPALANGIQSFAPRANLHVVPNIVTHCDYQPVEKRPSTSICVVADIVFSIKQQDTIIEVFSELPQMQFELHFYGGGPDESRLIELIKPRSNMFFHGRKSNAEILQHLPQHHALVLFSAYETFGITVFEARQAGLWAIAKKNFGGAPHYDEGCLTVESTDELKMALLKLAHLPQPKAANFEKLRPTSIGNTLSSLYSSLLFA